MRRAAGVLVVLVAAGACSGDDDAGVATTATAAATSVVAESTTAGSRDSAVPPSLSEGDGRYPLGSVVVVKDIGFEVTEYVTEVHEPEIAGGDVPEGSTLVGVRATLTNFGTNLGPSIVLVDLVGADGEQFRQAGFGPPWAPTATEARMMPGASVDTLTYFAVPANSIDDGALSIREAPTDEHTVLSLRPGEGSNTPPPLPPLPVQPDPGSGAPGSWRNPLPAGTVGEIPGRSVSVIRFDDDVDVGIALPDGWRVVVVEFESIVEGRDQGLIAAVVGESGELYLEISPCPEGGNEGSGPIRTTACFAIRDVDLASAELVVMGAVDETVFLAVR